ncbi:glycerophosphodiester phosphodiesterase family protein [uncultured Cohaesibacter sp.]|uniref:glycerophosphodiester phosphodiesterase family protein n=1 Tax=uncultured Cohaesibacter sp. TaxID=1002546 RepID=UPI0029303D70|nr:glycerophosphodiester phosphodiesterase family protein [uncultured Cohaesibacter sp.]
MTNPKLNAQRRVIEIHGHRGARGLMPENSLEGFLYALSIGTRTLEIDIQMTADNILVATHDFLLSKAQTRMIDGSWLEGDSPETISLSLEELKQFDIGGLRSGTDYAASFPDQAFLENVRIPSLDEVFATCKWYEEQNNAPITELNIEIKSDPRQSVHKARSERVVDELIETISEHRMEDHVIIQSFDWSLLDLVKDKAEVLKRSYLTISGNHTAHATCYPGSPWLGKTEFGDVIDSIPKAVHAAGGKSWSSHFKDLDEHLVKEARNLDLRILAWTVNEPDDISRMIDLGIDVIISDYPSRVQRKLLDHGMHWVKS